MTERRLNPGLHSAVAGLVASRSGAKAVACALTSPPASGRKRGQPQESSDLHAVISALVSTRSVGQATADALLEGAPIWQSESLWQELRARRAWGKAHGVPEPEVACCAAVERSKNTVSP